MACSTDDLDPSPLAESPRRTVRTGKILGRMPPERVPQELTDCDSASCPEILIWISRDLGTPRVDLENKEALGLILDMSLNMQGAQLLEERNETE
jgi:hypothetical protein